MLSLKETPYFLNWINLKRNIELKIYELKLENKAAAKYTKLTPNLMFKLLKHKQLHFRLIFIMDGKHLIIEPFWSWVDDAHHYHIYTDCGSYSRKQILTYFYEMFKHISVNIPKFLW